MNLQKMYRETGRTPSSILNLTPAELRYLYPLVERVEVDEEDKLLKMARGCITVNNRRAKVGMLPLIPKELLARMQE